MKRLLSARRGRTRLLLATILTAVLAVVVGFQIANSTYGDGAESEIDYSLTTSEGNFAQGPTSSFPNVTTNGTWEAWIYPTANGDYKHFIAKEYSFVFASYYGTYVWAFGNGAAWDNPAWYSTGITAPLNTWQHAAFVKTGGNMKFYLNGNLVFDGPATNTLGTNTSYPMTIGARIGTSLDWDGKIDEVKIWNVARTNAEILAGMHSRVAGNSTGLLGYWDFNEPSGTTVYTRATGSSNLNFIGNPSRLDVKELKSVSGGDTVVTFPRTYLPGIGGWTVPTGVSNARALVVAGGGGGGAWVGGGGGAGGYQELNSVSLGSGVITVKVGQGGQGASWNSTNYFDINGVRRAPTQGQASALGSLLTSEGGGWGGSHNANSTNILTATQVAPSIGGSGGGGTGNNGDGYSTLVTARLGASGTAGQGNNGGDGSSISGYWIAGGGGGAGTTGVGGASITVGGNGGSGKSTDITGSTANYAGGGGGAYWMGSASHGSGGSGGGGAAGTNGTYGTPNTGGGGGGGAHNVSSTGGSGGSGVVILRYKPAIDQAITLTASDQVTGSNIIPTATNAAFTIEAWLYPTNLSGWRGIFNQTPGLRDGSARTFLGASGGQLSGWINGGIGFDSGIYLKANEWSHVAMSVDGTTVKLYLNGSEVFSKADITRTTTAGSVFNLGGTHVTTENWLGSMDQVKVWTGALTAAEVASSMNNYSTTGVDNSLTAHFDFNEFNAPAEPNRTGLSSNLTLASTVTASSYSSQLISETSTAFSGAQNIVKFKRSYLTATDGWSPPSGVTRYKTLVVAGGGGGGGRHAGGGGAGGFVETSVTLTSAAQKITVGTGGMGSPYLATNTSINSITARTQRGGDSVAFGQTAKGGGAGAGKATDSATYSGGSGGGTDSSTSFSTPGSGQAGQGNAGGQGDGGGAGQIYTGGGGGGAGGAGSNVVTGSGQGGNGGTGRASAITGTSTFYSGGGGGASGEGKTTGGAGGSGGGGAGGTYGASAGLAGVNGTNGTGGGGGGGGFSGTVWAYTGGSGGSGVVILSYGPVLEVSRTSTSNRPGSAFNQALQVTLRQQDGTTAYTGGQATITVTAPAGVLQKNGVATTQETYTTIGGVATLDGLGFQSGVSSTQTLTFTADAFVGATASITPTYLPASVTITTSATTGTFSNGKFESNTNGAANILNSDLVSALVAGNIEISTTGSITISAAVQSTSANSLTLKAGTDILQGAVTVSTQGGAITYWSDTDGTSGGGIKIPASAIITSNGGAVTLSGGLDTATSWAKGTTATDGVGVWILGSISTGVGNVTIRGEEATSTSTTKMGVLLGANSSITTTSGSVTINGKVDGANTDVVNNHYGVWIGDNSVNLGRISTVDGAINIFGDATSNSRVNRRGVIFYAANVSSTNGSITVEGLAGTASGSNDVFFLLTGSGSNTLSSTNGAVLVKGSPTSTTYFDSSVTISSNNSVTLQLNNPAFNARSTSVNLGGSGTKVIESPLSRESFGADQTISNLTLDASSTSLRIGRTTNNVDLTISNSHSIVGPIRLYGQDINLNGSLEATGLGNEIRLKQTGYFNLAAAKNLTTNGGDVVIWTGSSKVQTINLPGSYIAIQDGTTISTKGGKIWLAGGLDDGGVDSGLTAEKGKWSDQIGNDGYPDGYATGANTSDTTAIGVFFNVTSTLKSGGGDIFIAGAQGPTNTAWYGSVVIDNKTKIDSGTGRIAIFGKALTGTNANSHGIAINYGTDNVGRTYITSSATSADAINIYSDESANAGADSRGIVCGYWYGPSATGLANQAVHIIATGAGGGVTLTGIAGQSSTSNGYGLWLEYTDVLAKSGKITLNGVGRNSSADRHGLMTGYRSLGGSLLRLGAASSTISSGSSIAMPDGTLFDSATSSSDIEINVDVLRNGESDWGIYTNTSGNVRIQPATLSDGFVSQTSNFKKAQTGTNFQFAKLASSLSPATFTLGRSNTVSDVDLASPISTTGSINIYGGDINLEQNLMSSASGGSILVKASGAITTTAGDNASTSPRKFTTAGGPITFWAGSDGNGSITIKNFTLIDSNSASTTNGGDITLGGNISSEAGNSNKPAGPVIAPSGNAISLGTSSNTNNVQILADGGKVYIGGKTSGTTAADSGVSYAPGLVVNAGEIEIYGETADAGIGNTGSGFYSTANASGSYAASSFTATDSFTDHTVAILVTSRSASLYSQLVGNYSLNTFETTGSKAGIRFDGATTASSSYGIWLGSTTLKTTSGNITIDSGNDLALLGKDSTRTLTLGGPSTTGSISIIGAAPDASRTIINTAGQVYIKPETNQSSFTAAVTTFPASTTSLSGRETGLFVGGENGNTAAVTVGAATSIAGPIYYWAGTLTVNNALTVSVNAENLNLTANQMTIGAALTSGTNSGTGSVQLSPLTATKVISLGGTDTASQLALTDAELDYVTAGKLRIGTFAETNSGNITVDAAISIATAKVGATAIRTTGTVSGTGTITATNLGIKAASINLGNAFAVSGSLALSAGAAPTFSSSTTYTPAQVDGIAADFGTATQITFSQLPQNGETQDKFMAVTFNPPPVATLKDKFGTALQTQNSTSAATITASKASGSGTLEGTLPKVATSGSATFSDIKITGATGAHTLTFTSGSITATTGTINVLAGEPAALVVSMTQTTISAGKAFDAGKKPTVTLKDSGGNTITSGTHATATVTATLIGTGGQVVAGATASAVSGTGVATFDNLALAGTVGGTYSVRYSVTYTNTSDVVTTVNSADTPVTFTPGDATQLEVTTPASSAASRAVFGVQPKISIKDAYGNVVTSSSTTITISENSADITLAGTVFMQAVDGVADFATNTTKTQLNGKKATGYTLTYTSTSPSLTTTQTIDLTYGAAYQLAKTTPASGFTNDVAFSVPPVITIQDQDGNTVENATDTVTVSTSAGAVLGGTVTKAASAGVASFSTNELKLTGPAATYTLTYAVTGLPSTTQSATITAGAAHHLTLTTSAANAKSRIAFGTQPVIEVRDISENPVPNSGLTIRATVTGASLTGTADVDANASTAKATFSGLALQGSASLGGYTITYEATTGSARSTSQVLPLAAGTATKLSVSPTTFTATNGVVFSSTPVVTVRDADDNPVLDSTHTVQVAISPSGPTMDGFADSTLSSGNGTTSFASAKLTGAAGSYTLTYTTTGTSLTQATQAITLVAGAADHLTITRAATGFVNRALFDVQPQVEIRDASNNLVTTSNADVTVEMSNGTLEGTKTVPAVNGVATFSGLYKYGLVGTTKVLTFTAAALTEAKQAEFTLTPGAVNKVVATTEAAGFRSYSAFTTQPEVTIQDQDGNTVTSFNGEVTVTSTGTASLSGTTKMNASSGVANFINKGLTLTGTIGANTLKYAIASPATYFAEQPVVLSAGNAYKLVLVTQATNFINRANFDVQPVVEVRDVSDNLVTTATDVVTASISSGEVTGNTTANAVNGVARFSGLGKYGLVGSKRLTFGAPGRFGTYQDFVLTHSNASGIRISTAGALTNGSNNVRPSAHIVDQDGNIVETGPESSMAVTFSSSDMTLYGQKTIPANAGVATVGTDFYVGAIVGTRTLSASTATPTALTGSGSVTVQAGAAYKVAIVQAAAGAAAGKAFTTQPKIQLADVGGNLLNIYLGYSPYNYRFEATINTGTLDGTKSSISYNSNFDFTNLGISNTAGSYTITYAAYHSRGDILQSTSQTIELTHGDASVVKLAGPTTAANGEVFATQPVVTIEDAYGNVVNSGAQSSQSVTLSTVLGASLGGTVTMNAYQGVANFDGKGVYMTGTAGSRALKATISMPTTRVGSKAFTLTAGTASKLVFSRVISGFRNDTPFTQQPIIIAQDANNNHVTNYTGEVLATQSAGTLGGTKIVPFVAGSATFTDLKLTGAASSSYTITFSSTGLSDASQTFTLEAGTAHHLEIIQAPTAAQNRIAFASGDQPIIEVRDISNNPVPNSGITIEASTTSLTLDGTKSVVVDATTGRATFSGLSLRGLITTNPTLRFADANPTGLATVTRQVAMSHGTATKLSVLPTTSTEVSGTTFATTPIVTVEDADANKVADSTLTVSATVAPVSGSVNATSTDGFADQTLGTSGQVSYPGARITGKAQGYTVTYAATGLTSAVQTITVGHSAATQLVKVAMPTSAKAGIGFTTKPKFEIQDASGNVVTTGSFATATVSATVDASTTGATLRTAGSTTSAINAQASAGVVEFTDISLVGTAGATYKINFAITAPSNSIAANQQTVALNAGDPYKLAITQQPTNVVAGVVFSPAPAVQIQDAWSNPVGAVASSVAIKADLVDTTNTMVQDTTQGAVTVSGSNDTATFSAITFSARGNHLLRFTATDLQSAVSAEFAIASAPAHHLVWVNEGSTTVRNGYVVATAPKLQIVDEFENPITTGAATTVAVTVSSANAVNVASINGASATNAAGSEFVEFTNLKLNAKTGAYKLRFTATNGTLPINNTYIDLTSTITVTYGDATKIEVATPAANARAGMALGTQPVIEVRDANDNVVADSTLQISASITDVGYGTVGTTTKTAVNGVANFDGTGLGITGLAGTGKTLNFSTILGSGSAVNATQTINLTAGTAAEIVMGQQPSTVQTGANMSPAPTVIVRDAWHNPVLTDSATLVKASLYRGTNLAGQQYISGQTATKTASAGTATFSGLQVVAPSKAGYTYRFQMVDGSANPIGVEIESTSFEITPGAPNSIVILQQPNTESGTSPNVVRTKSGELLKQQPSVQLLDASGNIATQIDSGSVTISVNGAGGSLSGQTSATLTDGVATFTGVKLHGVSARDSIAATGYTFNFSYNAISETTTDERIVDHNVAHHLTLVRNAGTARAGYFLTGTATPKVEIRDADNNLVNTTAEASSTILTEAAITSTGAAATVTGMAQTTAADGVAELYVGIGGSTLNSYTYTFSILNTPAVTAVSQSGVSITYGIATQLAVTTQPGALDVSSVRTKTGDALAVQPVVEFRDAYGNRVLDAGSSYRVDASIVGAAFDVRDRLTGASATATSGVVTFTNLALIGRPDHDYTLRFKWYNTNTQVDATQTVAVTHADAHHLTITRQPATGSAPNITKTGDRLAAQPIVEVRDFDDNVVTTNAAYASTPITATITTGGGSTTAVDGGVTNVGTVEIVNGVATFTDLKVVALPGVDQKLTFTGLNLTSVETNAFAVTFADAAKLAVITQPCTGSLNLSNVCQAGPTGGVLTVQPTVQVQDRFSNPVTNFSGDITVAATNGGSLEDSTGSLTVTLANTSDATFAGIALRGTPGTNYRLAFSSTGLTSVNSAQIAVTNSTATQIRVTTHPVGAKTDALLQVQPSVEILDRFNNVATTDSATQITVSPSGGELTGTTTVTVVNGVADFTDLKFVGTPGADYTLTFTATGLTSATSNSFQVTHADARTLVWLNQPAANIKTGDRITPSLKLVDVKGNTATTAAPSSITATVSGSNGSLVNATGTITAGVISFADLKLVGTPGTSYTIAISAVMTTGTITSAASSGITPTHAVPAEFIISDSAIGGLSGSIDPQDPALTTVPKLIIRDRFHNVATSDNTTRVTVSIASGLGGTLSGTTSVTAVNGVATFTGLVFAGTPGTQYTFSFAALAANRDEFSITDPTVVTVSKRSDITTAYVNQAYVPDAKVLPTTTTDNTTGVLTYTITEPAAIGVICNINASTGEITIKGAGACPVRVDVAATTYYRAHYAVTTFTIAKAVQAELKITSDDEVFYMQDALMGVPLLQPVATGGSTAATPRFWATGDCRLISGKLITGNAGSECSILATKAGDANYLSVSSAPMDITVKKVAQAALSIANTLTASVGDVELFTTGGSGEGAVSYTVDTAGTANCSIVDGTKLRAAANGTCVVFASKAESTNFNMLRTANKTFTFTKLLQSIAFTSTIPQSPVRGVSYTPVAVATSGGAVTYAITTGNGTACEIDPIAAAATPAVTKINFLALGTCTVTATQSGGSTYVSVSATQTIEVGQLNQTISFASLAEKTFGSPDFMISATSNSGLNVGFTVGAGTTQNACTVTASGLVSLQHEGLCEIAANQPGNATYAAAPTVRQSFYVNADLAGKPKITSISVANQSFTATFTAPSYLGGASALKYRLKLTQVDNGDEYANSNCSATPSSGSTLTCTVVGIPNNVAYNAEVAAITIAGIGNYSDAVGPLTPSANPMGVTQLTASQTTSTNLAVVWEEPVVLDAQLLTYEVYVAPLGSASFPSTPSATTTSLNANITIASSPMAAVSVSGNMAGGGFRAASVATFMHRTVTTPVYSSTGYQVKVVTVTDNYDPATSPTGDYQTIGQQIGLNAPSSPRSLTLTPTVTGLFISWATPLSDGGSPIASYDVFANGVAVLGCEAITATSCELTTLAAYTDYEITVVARSAADLTSLAAAATHDVEPAPAPPAPPVVEPTPTPTPTTPTPGPTTSPSTRPTPAPSGSGSVTPAPSGSPTAQPSGTPTSEPTAAPAPSAGPNAGPSDGSVPGLPGLITPPSLPTINPGEPVPNPAIGATGDDDAPPAEFDPTGTPEAVEAAVQTAVTGAVVASALAAAMAAAAAAAGAAAAAAAAGAAAGAYRKPEEFGEASEQSEGEGSDEPETIDVTQDHITIQHESWGDRLAMFALPFITFLDSRSHNAAERIGNISPFFAKLINDGAYLRAMLGTISTLVPITAAIIGVAAVADNAAEIAAGDYSKIITPAWTFLLAIAVLGAFDAAAGFTGAMVFIIGSIATVGHVPDTGEVRTMMGIMLVAVGPALLTTGFRSIRKHAALNFSAWWERIADFVIAPFMAGWSISAMVSGLPALAGLTLDVANHVADFSFFVAIAIFVRVALEELAAAGYPARLNRINPDEIPHPSILQRSFVLVIKYGVWVFIGGALIGPSWQVWVGSALFVFPTVVGWFTDKFPNSPRIWRILPTGMPGLAFTLIVASATSSVVAAILGTNPDLGKWSFLILPIPMLAITILGWFGRHGEIDADGNEEERPGKRNKWIYRIGGVIVMVLTLKLAGII